MDCKEKISIIVPVYNLENYIEKTLDSICAQTYSNLEIIAVDDGSKDNSFDVICKCAEKDKRIVPIHQENGGVTSARLNGVKHATGEWIGFCDGDDLIDKDMYELLIHNAYKYNSDISHCGYRMVFDDGRVNYFHNTGCLVEQDNLKGLCDLLDGSMIEPGLCNKLYHNTLFHSLLHDGFDLSIKNNEDLLMNYYLFKNSKKSVFDDFCPYQYMVRQGSASRTVNEHTIYDPIKVKSIITNDANKDLLLYTRKAYLGTCINAYNGLITNSNSKKDDIKKVRKYILDCKNDIALLSRNSKLLAIGIVYFQNLYKLFYRFYSNKIQKKKYS